MHTDIWSKISHKLLRASAGLPRRGICIRASCQTFGTNNEVEESIDGVCQSAVQRFLSNCWSAQSQSSVLGGIHGGI
jgi:hypothetical protein